MKIKVPKKITYKHLLFLLFLGSYLLAITLSLAYYKHQKSQETTNETSLDGLEYSVQYEEFATDNRDSNQDNTEGELTNTDISVSQTDEGALETTDSNSTGTTPTPMPEPEPTPEPEPEPDTITAVVAFYADNQSDTDAEDAVHQKTVNNILASGANPVFHAGDLMEDGTQDSLDRFNSVTATLRSTRTFYAALGNNDRTVGDSSTPSQLWLDNFSFPNNERWYSVNYGNLHMVILDSAFASSSSTQLNWLAADLQTAASQDRITGVMYHHPTFANSINSYLINYGVDFAVAGHVHSYSHSTSNGINYFTLSGQPSLGHMIGKIYHHKVVINVYNNNNSLIESVEFSER